MPGVCLACGLRFEDCDVHTRPSCISSVRRKQSFRVSPGTIICGSISRRGLRIDSRRRPMKTAKMTAAALALVMAAALPAVADEGKLKEATGQVESGAKATGHGIADTAKGVGHTVVEGAKTTGDKIKEAGQAAEPGAKSAWNRVKDGASDFGHSVK